MCFSNVCLEAPFSKLGFFIVACKQNTQTHSSYNHLQVTLCQFWGDCTLLGAVDFSGTFFSNSSLEKVPQYKLHSKGTYLTCTTKRIGLCMAATLDWQWRMTPRVTLLRAYYILFLNLLQQLYSRSWKLDSCGFWIIKSLKPDHYNLYLLKLVSAYAEVLLALKTSFFETA